MQICYVTTQHNTYNIQSSVCVCVCVCVQVCVWGIIESVPPHIWHPLGGFFHLLICELPAKAWNSIDKARESNDGVTHYIPGLCACRGFAALPE